MLFVGDHEDEEKWLNRNKGRRFVINNDSQIEGIRITNTENFNARSAESDPAYIPGTLHSALPESDYDRLVDGIPRSIAKKMEELTSFNSEDDILSIVENIIDETQKSLVLGVLLSLREGDVDEAKRSISYHFGEMQDITSDPADSSDRFHLIPENDPAYAELFEHFVKTADYKQWMLFMHPRQQEIVDLDFSTSGKLLGVSGSGKTCIVVKRATRLASIFPEEKILIVTLNKSLSYLIRELIEAFSHGNGTNNIEVLPLFELCQRYLKEYEPENYKLYDNITWKSLEHIDEIWEEFYRCELNNNDAAVLHPVHDYFLAMGINAQNYIREEFDWVRSAFSEEFRNDYLKVEREGRCIPLMTKYRKMILEGLSAWETKMRDVGVVDYLGIATALNRHAEKLTPRYRSVLIDESQDFGTVELSLIRKITIEGGNDIFICGDAAQRVSTKFQSLKKAGLSVQGGSTKKIIKNYRNSREVLSAAYDVLLQGLCDEMDASDDFEVLDPEYSNFSGPASLLLSADSLEDEIAHAIAFAEHEISSNPNLKACIAFCGFSLYEIQVFGNLIGRKVLEGSTSLGSDSIFLSDLEQTKGFEFDVMIVLNCGSSVIPSPTLPEKENYRELSTLYVALTRAKHQLVVSYNQGLSHFVEHAKTNFLEEEWSKYLTDKPHLFGRPQRMDELRESVDVIKHEIFMSGPEFLYTTEAIGLSSTFIDKLRDLIPGKSVTRNGHLVKWKNLGSAYDSCRENPRSRQAFGPEGILQFRQLCERLYFDKKLSNYKKSDIYRGST